MYYDSRLDVDGVGYQFTQPAITPISDRGEKQYVLDNDYEVRWLAACGAVERLLVPRGLLYDGITSIRKDGLKRGGAAAHDFAYEHKGKFRMGCWLWWIADRHEWADGTIDGCADSMTRQEADHMAIQLFAQAGVSGFQCRVARNVLRFGGYYFWREWY